jgi:branched-chain amino acid transport system ATP-binding protein
MRLALDNITAGYGGTTVLRDVDLVVPDGRTVALLGPNGAGKSTLLAVASGLVRPAKGRVTLDDDDVSDLTPPRRVDRGLCHITESGATFPGLTVADNLRIFTPRAAGEDSLERVVDAFPRLGQRMHQAAGTLSGGEQRMLALARAYATRARTVLLDELSLGLAPIIVDEIFEFLGRLAAEGVSLLIVEQYVTKVMRVADFVYVLARGRIAFAGEPSELAHTDLIQQYLGVQVVA